MRRAIIIAVAIIPILVGIAFARPLGHEAQAIIDTLLATPAIKAEPGFGAKMLIPPGELYDPLGVVKWRDTIVMNDAGKAIGDHGGRLLRITPEGKISVVMDADALTPVAAFDIAPPGFGNFSGQIFALAQPTSAMKGANASHVIQRIDLKNHSITLVCTLPTAGSVGNGVPGLGTDARFGPPGSPFADAFYSITILNDMIYKTSASGECKPFADLAKVGSPQGMAFTADGTAMLVTVVAGEGLPSANTTNKGKMIRIGPDGTIDPRPVAQGFIGPSGIAIAPPGFGKYAGQIFVTDNGDFEAPVPQSQPLKRDGKVYRVTPAGEIKIVASGFINPTCISAIGKHLWVSDLNGEFTIGMRELPDGFVVQIDAE